MWCNIILVVIMLVVAFVGFTGYALAKENSGSAFDQLSRMDLNNNLEQLPPNPDAWNEPVSAMCYSTAPPVNMNQYICPVCGEMTLYSYIDAIGIDVSKISYFQNLIKKIKKFNVKLDESQLCENCTPKAKTRKLCIIVQYDQKSKPHKTCGINEEDITLLYEYSEGTNVHTDLFGSRIHMNLYKQRLEELLGVSIDDIK